MEEDLAMAVLMQAEKDAHIKKANYDQITARNFLCGATSSWRDSLENWCILAGLDYNSVLKSSRKKWRPDLLKEGECKSK